MMIMMDLEQSFPNSQFSNTHKQQQQRKAWVSESWWWMLIVIVITHRLIVIVIIVITHLVQNCLLHIIVKLRSCHHANVIIIGDRNIKKNVFFSSIWSDFDFDIGGIFLRGLHSDLYCLQAGYIARSLHLLQKCENINPSPAPLGLK